VSLIQRIPYFRVKITEKSSLGPDEVSRVTCTNTLCNVVVFYDWLGTVQRFSSGACVSCTNTSCNVVVFVTDLQQNCVAVTLMLPR
jgi:hypothetical protein